MGKQTFSFSRSSVEDSESKGGSTLSLSRLPKPDRPSFPSRRTNYFPILFAAFYLFVLALDLAVATAIAELVLWFGRMLGVIK